MYTYARIETERYRVFDQGCAEDFFYLGRGSERAREGGRERERERKRDIKVTVSV